MFTMGYIAPEIPLHTEQSTTAAFLSPDLKKALIEDAVAPVAENLTELARLITDYIPTESETSKRILNHVFGAGGKRIRPALYFMCCRLVGYKGDHLYPIAAVSEYVHTASLLHDDVVDNSTLRRNMPTANSIYGDEAAVLVGDLIYSRASELMAATGSMEIVNTFARAIRLMSEGELLQLENLFNSGMKAEAYLKILECKTAILIEATCKSAGLLADVDPVTLRNLCDFGYGVGMAFQLIDDALDYTGDAPLVGKDILSDLKEGKVTLPVILLNQLATPAEWQIVTQTINAPVITTDMVRSVAGLVDKYETAAMTVDKAHEFTMRAMNALHSFPAGEERDTLENLANKLLMRFN
jgi:geranylgeranyl pyrophosphate synthase